MLVVGMSKIDPFEILLHLQRIISLLLRFRDRKHVNKEPETHYYDLCFVREKDCLVCSTSQLSCRFDCGDSFLFIFKKVIYQETCFGALISTSNLYLKQYNNMNEKIYIYDWSLGQIHSVSQHQWNPPALQNKMCSCTVI